MIVFGGQSDATRAKRKTKVPYRIRRLRQLVKKQDQKVKRASADRARKLAADRACKLAAGVPSKNKKSRN